MRQKLLPIIELQSPKERLEKYLSFSDKRPNFLKRNIYNALNWNAIAVKFEYKPDKEVIEKSQILGGELMYVDPIFEKQVEILQLQKKFNSARLRDILKNWKASWIAAMNSITNDGEIAYTIEVDRDKSPAANEDFFNTALSREQLANPAVQNTPAAADTWDQFDNPPAAAISGSNKVYDATYPIQDDPDADNTSAGVDVLSFLTSYTTGDFNDGGTTIKNFAILDNVTPTNPTKLLTHGTIAAFNKTSSDTLKFFINHEQRRV